MYLYSQPNPYIFNANIIESKFGFISCTVCGSPITAQARSKSMVCFACGVHMHFECAINSKRMLNVKSNVPMDVFICSECVNQSVDSVQMMLLRNALLAMNYTNMIDSGSHLPRLFQRDVLLIASKLHSERQEFYQKTEVEVFIPFFVKSGNVALSYRRLIVACAARIEPFDGRFGPLIWKKARLSPQSQIRSDLFLFIPRFSGEQRMFS